VIFAGLNFLDIFILLMRKRYDTLANHFVDVGGAFNSNDEVIAHLRSRVAPIPFPIAESKALAA
jgi:hypothetical protein